MTAEVDSQDFCAGKEDTTANELLSLVSTSFLPSQNVSLDHPLEAAAFKEHINNCERNFKKATYLLINQNERTSLSKTTIISLILLCGEHSKIDLWTSSQTVICAEKLLKLLIERCQCQHVVDLLLHCKIELIFAELRPKLLKNTWKNNPAGVACFIWVLSQIKCPDLGEVLNCVLPTCLLLIDDHEYDNKIKGLQCIQHVANNLSRAELNQYGQGSVIYDALEHMIYLREPEVIPPLGACLTALLSKTEHRSTTETLAWTHFDDVLNIWLPSMQMEQKLSLREAYIESLDSLLQAMGLASVRWTHKLIFIFYEYCEQDHTREKALETLQTFMKTTWPRLPANFEPLTIILMRLVIQLSRRMSKEPLRATFKLIRQCFTLLEKQCPEEYYGFERQMDGVIRDFLLGGIDHLVNYEY